MSHFIGMGILWIALNRTDVGYWRFTLTEIEHIALETQRNVWKIVKRNFAVRECCHWEPKGENNYVDSFEFNFDQVFSFVDH